MIDVSERVIVRLGVWLEDAPTPTRLRVVWFTSEPLLPSDAVALRAHLERWEVTVRKDQLGF